MKKLAIISLFVLIQVIGSVSMAQAQQKPLDGMWSVSLEFGEIPFHGSFKPGIAVGYHFNDYIWTGVVYQIPDSISRDGTSFNANAIGLDGMTGSTETVGQRAMLQARIRPHRYSPYVSIGAVFNDRDTETVQFDDRDRMIGGDQVSGPMSIELSRPAAVRPSLGLGYSFTFDNGIHLFTEWAGWWMFGAPDPEITIKGEGVTGGASDYLKRKITDDFTSSPFNTYHMFQLGAGYTW